MSPPVLLTVMCVILCMLPHESIQNKTIIHFSQNSRGQKSDRTGLIDYALQRFIGEPNEYAVSHLGRMDRLSAFVQTKHTNIQTHTQAVSSKWRRHACGYAGILSRIAAHILFSLEVFFYRWNEPLSQGKKVLQGHGEVKPSSTVCAYKQRSLFLINLWYISNRHLEHNWENDRSIK